MLNSRAWSDGIIIVVNPESGITSQIEEKFSVADPAIESFIFTFTDVSEAVKFSKNRADIKLCILADSFPDVTCAALFDNIKNQCSISSLTPRVLFTYESPPKLDLYRESLKRTEVIDYIPLKDLTGDNTKAAIKKIFDRFVGSYESQTIPEELGYLIHDIAGLGEETVRLKYERISILIGSQMNLSFDEVILLKWMPYLEKLFSGGNHSVMRHSAVGKIYSCYARSLEKSDASANAIFQVFKEIEKLASGRTESASVYLSELRKNIRPSSPAVERILARNSDRIIGVLDSLDSATSSKIAGAA